MIQVISDISNLWGTARNQETKPTCLAFVVSDMNAALNEIAENLSVEYLCYQTAKRVPNWNGEGFTTDVMFEAAAQDGQPHESLYPYLPLDSHASLKVPPSGLLPIYHSKLQSIKNGKASKLKEVFLECKVIGIVIAVTKSLFQPVDGLVIYDPMAIQDAYHALIVSGIGKHIETEEEYFLVRNSWGTNWGINGYCWISHSFLDLHLIEIFTLDQNGKTI